MILGAGDDEFHAIVDGRRAGRRVANRQAHDGRLVPAAQLACAAELANVPDAYLTSGRRVKNRRALAAQGNVVNKRLSFLNNQNQRYSIAFRIVRDTYLEATEGFAIRLHWPGVRSQANRKSSTF